MARRKVNSAWSSGAGALSAGPSVPTEFEAQARRLGLDEIAYAGSPELLAWCERNRHRCYVPEWLLAEWGLRVEPTLSE